MKIAIIHWGCVRHDAISALVRDHVLWCRAAGHDARFVGGPNDYPELPHIRLGHVSDALQEPFLDECDVLIFHFGVHYSLFDLLLEQKSRGKRLVFFHNVTPKEFVAEDSWELIDNSYTQMRNCAYADEVICVSETNRDVLTSFSIHAPMSVMLLPVECAVKGVLAKPSFMDGNIRLAFIGRFVKSKGPGELLEALERIAGDISDAPIVLTMAGNIGFSNKGVLEEVLAAIARLHAAHSHIRVHFRGDIADEDKERFLAEADIFVLPTYHEGFCVPVLEALAHGCRVISYDNSNLPAVSGGLASLVATGNVEALSLALKNDVSCVCSADWRENGWSLHAAAAAQHMDQFHPARIKAQFFATIERIASQ